MQESDPLVFRLHHLDSNSVFSFRFLLLLLLSLLFLSDLRPMAVTCRNDSERFLQQGPVTPPSEEIVTSAARAQRAAAAAKCRGLAATL